MNRAFLRTRVRWLLLLVVPLSLMGGCVFEAGVGDPAEAKVKREFAGYWTASQGGNVWVIKALPNEDKTKYDLEFLSCKGTLEEPTRKELRVVADVWLVEIGKVQFATADVKMVNDATVAKPFMVFKIKRADETLELTPLSDKFTAFKQAKTREQMERAVKDNLENASAFSDTTLFKRTTADAAKKVLDLFE